MKLIFHIDVNSAFLSWTACGLLEEGGVDTLPTDIREIASVIGGSEKSRHGIVRRAHLPNNMGSSQASHSFRPGANARVWLWCRQITSYTCENPTS